MKIGSKPRKTPPKASWLKPACTADVRETSFKYQCKTAEFAIYVEYYTKYTTFPKSKWRRSIAKDVDLLNFQR